MAFPEEVALELETQQMRTFQAEGTCAIQNSVSQKQLGMGGDWVSEDGIRRWKGNHVIRSQWSVMKREHKTIHSDFLQLHENMAVYTNNDTKVVSKIAD